VRLIKACPLGAQEDWPAKRQVEGGVVDTDPHTRCTRPHTLNLHFFSLHRYLSAKYARFELLSANGALFAIGARTDLKGFIRHSDATERV
jgi:hypothetical protein